MYSLCYIHSVNLALHIPLVSIYRESSGGVNDHVHTFGVRRASKIGMNAVRGALV